MSPAAFDSHSHWARQDWGWGSHLSWPSSLVSETWEVKASHGILAGQGWPGLPRTEVKRRWCLCVEGLRRRLRATHSFVGNRPVTACDSPFFPPLPPPAPPLLFSPLSPRSYLALSELAAQWICINKKQSGAAVILAINV